MRICKMEQRTISADDSAGRAWREELLGTALEVSIGISRLMDAVRLGPPQSPPRRRTSARRIRT
jgi:hypothetical protein